MRLALGVAAFTALTSIAALHLFWAVRNRPGGGAVVPEVNGAPAFRPTRAHSVAVAGALSVGAVLVAIALGGPGGVLVLVARLGCVAMASVFAARTVGDFRRVGAFKRRAHASRFEYWDDRLYTPLCAALSVASFVVAVG